MLSWLHYPRIYLAMDTRERDSEGRFEQKGDEPRIQRGVKLTDICWDALGDIAAQEKCSRADLIERVIEDDLFGTDNEQDEALVKDDILDIIKDVLDSLEPGEEPLIELSNNRDKAPARRVLSVLLEYLENTL